MKVPTLICPYSRPLLDQIYGYGIAVKVDHCEDISRAAEDIRSSGRTLVSVLIEVEKPLGTVNFQEDWQGIPIALSVPEVGNYRDISNKIKRMRDLKIHVYLPAGNRENLTGSRILASLGVTCCLVFGEVPPNWEALSDLMTYSLFGINKHAPIEPFNYISEHYKPGANVDWGSVYFDGGREFLHLDGKGRVALSQRELLKGSFIAEDIPTIKTPLENKKYRKGINAWRQYFLCDHPCITCEGWKVCFGRFGFYGKHAGECSTFVADMLPELEQCRNQQQQVTLSENS
jgi:hypothetical protein